MNCSEFEMDALCRLWSRPRCSHSSLSPSWTTTSSTPLVALRSTRMLWPAPQVCLKRPLSISHHQVFGFCTQTAALVSLTSHHLRPSTTPTVLHEHPRLAHTLPTPPFLRQVCSTIRTSSWLHPPNHGVKRHRKGERQGSTSTRRGGLITSRACFGSGSGWG